MAVEGTAKPAEVLAGIVYITLPGGSSFWNVSVTLYNAENGNRLATPKCQPQECVVPLRPGIYYLQVAREGSWPFTSAPFTVAPNQKIPFQPNLTREEPHVTARDLLNYFSVLLVVLGLFREQLIRSLIYYPKLTVEAAVGLPYCHLAQMSWQQMAAESQPASAGASAATSGTPAPAKPAPLTSLPNADRFGVYFCRIFVRNAGTGEATDVDVFVSSMWEVKGAQVEKVNKFLPLNLRWANSWSFYRRQARLENDEPLRKARISAGIGRFCDLGFIVEPNAACQYFQKAGITVDPTGFTDQAIFQFAFETLETAEGRWSNNHRLLELAIDGNNMETELYYIQLKVQGRWSAACGPETFNVKTADPKLVKLAGKRPSRYHLHDIRELFRRKRSSPDLDEA